jgi:hypothetical protein
MRALSAAELLDVWERGAPLSWARRAGLLMEASQDISTVASALSIGARDAWLLRLRKQTFGSDVEGVAVCPACRDSVEMRFAVDDIQVDAPSSESPHTFTLSQSGWNVAFRLPTAADLADLPNEPDAARRCLLDRCMTSGQGSLPDAVLDAVVAKMAEADPQADVQVALQCPSCGHHWRAAFDIVSFFWTEIHAWACRMLRDVHTLASAYGWKETDVLSMSPVRRRWYLGMVNS